MESEEVGCCHSAYARSVSGSRADAYTKSCEESSPHLALDRSRFLIDHGLIRQRFLLPMKGIEPIRQSVLTSDEHRAR